MPIYRVILERTRREFEETSIEVEAATEEEARETALEEGWNADWHYQDEEVTDYRVENVEAA